jgi:hypothetical protein
MVADPKSLTLTHANRGWYFSLKITDVLVFKNTWFNVICYITIFIPNLKKCIIWERRLKKGSINIKWALNSKYFLFCT